MSTAEITAQFTHLPPELETQLVCPACKCQLEVRRAQCQCTHPGCLATYPIRSQVPVLFSELTSLFSIAGVLAGEDKPFKQAPGRLRQVALEPRPVISANPSARANYRAFAEQLLASTPAPRVLVIGARELGAGMSVLAEFPEIQVVESDVELGPRPAVLFDAHDIPFEDGTFDGVVAQAVLEHVADPTRCVAELHRVLRPGGIVYAETPFMQQVHEGPYDFTRFTHVGHRRLFRDFDEVASGVAGGPGMALAWAWQYFLLAFACTHRTRTVARMVARLTAWPLKYFDRLLARRAGAYDAASGYWFLGRRSTARLTDRQIISTYRGLIGS